MTDQSHSFLQQNNMENIKIPRLSNKNKKRFDEENKLQMKQKMSETPVSHVQKRLQNTTITPGYKAANLNEGKIVKYGTMEDDL